MSGSGGWRWGRPPTVVIAGLFSGLALVLAFPKPGLAAIGWIALVPWFAALPGATVRRGAASGLLFGLGFFGPLLYWVIPALHRHGGLGLPTAAAVFLLLIVYLAGFPALFGAAAGAVGSRTGTLLLMLFLPVAWVEVELLRARFPVFGFPWGLLGVIPYRHPAWLQSAALGGVYLASFWMAAGNALLAAGWRSRGRRRWGAFAAALLLVVAVPWLGHRSMPPVGEGSLRVAVVQANISQQRKWDAAFREQILERYSDLTRRALDAGADLVVWPEAALPFALPPLPAQPAGGGAADPIRARLAALLADREAALLVGAVEHRGSASGRRAYNTAQFLDDAGIWNRPYDKVHLVPMVEFVPWPRLLFFVHRMAGGAIADFAPGNGPVLHRVDDTPFAASICFEMIFPHRMRAPAAAGAHFLVNLTNDGWFGRTAGPQQHFPMSVLRAVETGRWVVRAANTGISAFIDPSGRLIDSLPIGRADLLQVSIDPDDRSTPYMRHGDRFAGACGIIAVAGIAAAFVARRRSVSAPVRRS